MIQGYFVQEVVGDVKPVHYEQKHLKFKRNLKALCQMANCQETSCIIQTVSPCIQWLYRIRLHIYIKCRRNKHLQ